MRSQVLAACLLGITMRSAFGQAPVVPVQAEFLKPVQTRKLAVGATVLAKVTSEWNGPGCVLHPGAFLEAKVETSEPVKNGGSVLALSFDRAQCGSELQPFPLVLVAAAAPPIDQKAVPDVEINSPRLRPHPVGELKGPSEPIFQVSSEHLEFTGIVHQFPFKPNLRPGDILGIRGVKLDVGAGPNRSSAFSSARGDLSLKAFTQILLTPPSVAFVPAIAPLPNSVTGAVELTRPKRPVPPAWGVAANTLEVCKPPACVVDRPVTEVDLNSQTLGSIALKPLGYKRRSRRLLAEFDRDTALAWLGADEVLFAFNSHPLIRRGTDSPETARVVRAVLLSVSTHAVLASTDWKIHDSGRFLWQLDATRVLVHVGDELHVYGSGLELERSVRLGGALQFLGTSPSGDSIILGTRQERHSQELHARLRDELGAEPEEDVDITMLDKDFRIVTSGITQPGLTPPTLLNEGQVSLRPQPEGDYRLMIEKWESTTATLARFKSLCVPQVSGISPDLLFLVSCVTNVGEPEYRVLHADGTLMLRGRPGSRRSGIEGAGNPRRFAVKSVSLPGTDQQGLPFSASDLKFAEIRIYRTEDGKRLAALRVDEPSTSYGGFALSPDGSQMAVLSGSEIRVFAIPDE